MNKNRCLFLTGALILVLSVTACAPQEEETPIVIQTSPGLQTVTLPAPGTETLPPGTETTLAIGTPDTTATVDLAGTPLATVTAQTPNVPVTGVGDILLECQFCIDNIAHTLLVFPDTTTYELVSPAASVTETGIATGCNVIDTFNGRQIVLCRAEENTSMVLNLCINGINCAQLQVDLQACANPAAPQPGAVNTVEPNVATDTPFAGATDTLLAEPTSTP